METHGPAGIVLVAFGLVLLGASLAWLLALLLSLIVSPIALAMHAAHRRAGPRVRRGAVAMLGATLVLTSGIGLRSLVGHEARPATVRRSDVDSTWTAVFGRDPAGTRLDAGTRASILRGRAILLATRDSMPGNVGNALRCTNCHLDGGTRKGALPWIGVYARFPQYRPREGRVLSIEDRVNGCLIRSMNGRALAPRDPDMQDIVAYMKFLSSEAAAFGGATQPLQVVAPAGPPDAVRGRTLFALDCSICHGANGEGSLIAPPLWGPASFNVGAGMARVRTAAAFIKATMPFNRPGTLSSADAFDVAQYLVSQPRPDFAGKELDWPRGDAPPDVAYATVAGTSRAHPSPRR